MGSIAHRLGLVGLLAVTACTSTASTTAQQTTTVARRHWFAICAGGDCPNYDVTVSADGRVSAILHHLDEPDEVQQFRVSRSEAAEFLAKRPYRPAGDVSPIICSHGGRLEDAPLMMKVTEIEIKWSGPSRPARLVSCDTADNRDLVESIRQALWSIHLYPSGRRRD